MMELWVLQSRETPSTPSKFPHPHPRDCGLPVEEVSVLSALLVSLPLTTIWIPFLGSLWATHKISQHFEANLLLEQNHVPISSLRYMTKIRTAMNL